MAIINYVRTGPFVNGSSPGISANFLNAVEAILQQNSGGQESGRYFVGGFSTAASQTISNYIVTLSRTTVPVSVNFDETDTTHSASLSTPTTGHLTSGGFQMYAISNASNGNSIWGGNWNVLY